MKLERRLLDVIITIVYSHVRFDGQVGLYGVADYE